MKEGFRIAWCQEKHIHFCFVPFKVVFLIPSIPEYQESFCGRILLPFSIHTSNIRVYIKGYSEVQFKTFKIISYNILN